eukprot:358669-Chlamydomonas_euryale.AAC.4
MASGQVRLRSATPKRTMREAGPRGDMHAFLECPLLHITCINGKIFGGRIAQRGHSLGAGSATAHGQPS